MPYYYAAVLILMLIVCVYAHVIQPSSSAFMSPARVGTCILFHGRVAAEVYRRVPTSAFALSL